LLSWPTISKNGRSEHAVDAPFSGPSPRPAERLKS